MTGRLATAGRVAAERRVALRSTRVQVRSWPLAQVQSWVSANCAELNLLVHDAVANWLATEWRFTDVRYRPAGSPQQPVG
jgi:hypothetical protein